MHRRRTKGGGLENVKDNNERKESKKREKRKMLSTLWART